MGSGFLPERLSRPKESIIHSPVVAEPIQTNAEYERGSIVIETWNTLDVVMLKC